MGALHDAVHAAVDEQFRSESSPKRQRKPRVGWRKWEQVVVYEVRSLNDFRCFVGIVIKSNMARVAMAAIERLMKDGEQLSDYAIRIVGVRNTKEAALELRAQWIDMLMKKHRDLLRGRLPPREGSVRVRRARMRMEAAARKVAEHQRA